MWDMHGVTHKLPAAADDVPIHFGGRRVVFRRSGWNGLGRNSPYDCDKDDADARNLSRDDPARNRASQYGKVGPSLHKTGSAEDFVFFQMLRQDCVFDRPEKGRVHSHRKQSDKHQRDIVQIYTSGTKKHDENLRRFHHADDLCLFNCVCQLSGQRRKKEKRQDEQSPCNRVKTRLLRWI